jgi:nucleotide-binding universal stress UspA family protein
MSEAGSGSGAPRAGDAGRPPDRTGGPYTGVLVGTDGSGTARLAVARAAEVATVMRARLLIAFVGDAEAGAPVLQELADQLGGPGLVVETHLLSGDPADGLLGLARAERVELVVVGNRGMTGAQRFLLGSVPNKVSHRAHCDVLIVHTTDARR